MSCNTCPLLEVCETAMEFDRLGDHFNRESEFQTLQERRQSEWEELANQQPIYIDAEDKLDETSQLILKAEARILAAQVALDHVEHVVSKTEAVLYSNKAALIRDEIGCPGPIESRKWKVIGNATLECASSARRERAEQSLVKLRLDND